jgi:putative heme transporter
MAEKNHSIPTPSDRTLKIWALVGIIIWIVVGAGLAIGGVGKVLVTLAESLTAFLLAGLICALMRPLTHRMKARGMKDGLAAILGVLIAVAGIALLTVFFAAPIISGATGLVANLPGAVAATTAKLQTSIQAYQGLPENVRTGIESALNSLGSTLVEVVKGSITAVVGGIAGVFGFGISLFMALILTFWFLKDGPKLAEALYGMVPRDWRDDVQVIAQSFDRSFSGWLLATAINCSVIFLLDGLGFTLIGLPYAWFIAAMVAMLGVIPFVGSILSAVIAIIVGLSVGPVVGIETGICVFVVDQIVYSFLGPIVAGKVVTLHPVTVIFALAVGASLGGFLGAILALPVAAAIHTVWDYYANKMSPDEIPPPLFAEDEGMAS